jgi:DNA-binding NarL/FixJ family response regulator
MNMDTIDEWVKRHKLNNYSAPYDLDELFSELTKDDESIVIADYDSVAQDINRLISSDKLPKNLIVLERTPEVVTGKMLISHGIKAYGNSRMMGIHYQQMVKTVQEGKVWTYPELTVALVKNTKKPIISLESQELLEKRLSNKEKEIVYLILEGLTNDAIASKLAMTTRTVKAHITSIFQKLHINDRLSLVLLLK